MPDPSSEKLFKVAEKLLQIWGVASGGTTVAQVMRAAEYLGGMNFGSIDLTKPIGKVAEDVVEGIKAFEKTILRTAVPTGILVPSIAQAMRPGCQDCSDDDVPTGDLSNPNGSIVFWFMDPSMPKKVGGVDTLDLIHQSWLAWGLHIKDFKLLMVTHPNAANVVVRASKIDGKGDVLGRAPKAGPGRLLTQLSVTLDSEDLVDWSQEMFVAVMTHEAGHILGLDHLDDMVGNNLMNKVIPSGVLEPTENDLKTLHRLWPKQENVSNGGIIV